MGKDIQQVNIKELTAAVSLICDEKGIDRAIILSIVEDALAAAYKKDYGKKGQIIKAKFDPETQTAAFYQVKEIVDETLRNMEEREESATEEQPAGETSAKAVLVEKTDKESAEKAKNTAAFQDSENEEETLPRFSPERDILLAEAKKIDKKAELSGEIHLPLEPQNSFGRVAAQNAKQVIIQKLREAERETLFEEFKNKEGEVIGATVQRVENRNVYLDLGKMVGVLFPSDQVYGENYRSGQRIKVYIAKVDKDAKDTSVTLSRAHPGLVKKLFSLEVPEIFSGTVTIESIAREPGSRSKIAVKSQEEGIDPIGSCVGQKGIRVQAIIDELGGEKIDIIEFNDDPKKFISHALAPAKVKYVEIADEDQRATVTVDPDQLSLAIGRKGQNVRLAAKLTGWKIDVVSSEEEGAEATEAKTAEKPETTSEEPQVEEDTTKETAKKPTPEETETTPTEAEDSEEPKEETTETSTK